MEQCVAERTPVVVFVHDGNFTGSGSFRCASQRTRIRRELGCLAAEIEFPDVGGMTAEEAYDVVAGRCDAHAEVVLVGVSSGGFVAAACGDRPSVVAVVALASPLTPFSRAPLPSRLPSK